jgi:hypothetical protein
MDAFTALPLTGQIVALLIVAATVIIALGNLYIARKGGRW